uniref:hypothetical protein n=1 Tax=Alloprevotella sp. TaxID=1872471 RepID=UPI0040299D1F
KNIYLSAKIRILNEIKAFFRFSNDTFCENTAFTLLFRLVYCNFAALKTSDNVISKRYARTKF